MTQKRFDANNVSTLARDAKHAADKLLELLVFGNESRTLFGDEKYSDYRRPVGMSSVDPKAVYEVARTLFASSKQLEYWSGSWARLKQAAVQSAIDEAKANGYRDAMNLVSDLRRSKDDPLERMALGWAEAAIAEREEAIRLDAERKKWDEQAAKSEEEEAE